ncbi:ribonuclease HIII [Bacillus sp. FJAT-27916]|uniref:ribonuclease HIII n=1 Tax=Bacillus sp. FJAT-27916 TaxID=1679169 RepID=UPI000670A6E1|nr:ribonuclease HIII [Bacillus sp. FJAT-27916]KMY43547.1 ribonuclease HIII [Bacillus sp. FJAT-27916]
MSNTVIKVSNDTLYKMKDHYAASITANTPAGAVFSAKVNGATITAYKSGKVLFQGSNTTAEAKKWGSTGTAPAQKKSGSPFTKRNVSDHSYRPPGTINQLNIIGTDEAGTGDYFGPVTVAAAYVSSEHIRVLEDMGIRDSKTIKDPQILILGRKITEMIPYSLLVLRNEKYNQLQAKGYSQGKMKAMLHEQAINHLLGKLNDIKPDGILIDQFCEPGVYFRHTGTTGKREVPLYFSTKAESISTAVAAASVIARYAFLKHMDLLSEQAGVTIPKGAGSKVDDTAALIIAKKGEAALGPLAKMHFANTEKARQIVRKAGL